MHFLRIMNLGANSIYWFPPEMHKTQTDFENQLIFKVFLFQFVNFYSSIIYIGFFKGK